MYGSGLFPGVQTFCEEVGEAACYALQLINVCEKRIVKALPILDYLKLGITSGKIAYNWNDKTDNNNFFVNDPAGFITLMTGLKCTVRKEGPDYKAKEGEYVINRWERVTTTKTFCHFASDGFDSLVDSQTVKFGKIASTRVVSFA
jgi:hypothetical protein